MSGLHERSALELAAAIRGGEVASREVLDHLLDRIERLNGPINAVVTIDGERARAEAELADDATARGDELGPLHGVPITVKDSFSTAGMRTTSGAPMLADYVPAAANLADQSFVVDTDATPEASLEEVFTLFDTLLQAVPGAGTRPRSWTSGPSCRGAIHYRCSDAAGQCATETGCEPTKRANRCAFDGISSSTPGMPS